MQKNTQIVGDFLVWLGAGHSKCTVDSYRYALTPLLRWLSAEQIQILNLTMVDVGRYQQSLENKGLKGSTRFHYATALRSLWRWLHDQERVRWSWKLIPMPDSSDKTRMPALEVEEFEKIMRYFNEDIPREMRDKTIISLLFATGLRLSELVSLDVSNVDMKERVLNVRTFKRRNHHRDGFWDDDTHALLEKWLRVRSGLMDRVRSGSNAIFIGLNTQRPGERIDKNAIQKRFRQLRKDLRIDKKISAHTCRHGFGTYFGKRSGDVFSLQQLMGHANINHTQHYVHHKREELREAYAVAHKNTSKRIPAPLTQPLAVDIIKLYATTREKEAESEDVRVVQKIERTNVFSGDR